MDTWQEWRTRAKQWKADKGLTDSQIAVAVGRERPTVNSWFNEREPNLADFMATCAAMGADAKLILFGSPVQAVTDQAAPQSMNKIESDLLAHFRAADPRWRLALRLLAALGVNQQIEAAEDVNVIIARILGMKTAVKPKYTNRQTAKILGYPAPVRARKAKESAKRKAKRDAKMVAKENAKEKK